MKIKIFAGSLLIIAVGLIAYGSYLNFDVEEVNTKVYTYSYGDIKTLEFCISNEKCSILPLEYSPLTYDTDVVEIQNFVDEINESMNKYYDDALKSNLNDVSCDAVRNLYQHNIRPHFDITVYESKEVTNITLSSLITNLCTNHQEYAPIQTYLYDKQAKKTLTQKELMDKYNVSLQEVESAIKKSLLSRNSVSGTNFTMEDVNDRDYVIYFDRDGNLLVSYFLNDSYYSITL